MSVLERFSKHVCYRITITHLLLAQLPVNPAHKGTGVVKHAKVRVTLKPASGSKVLLVAPGMGVQPAVLDVTGTSFCPFLKNHWNVNTPEAPLGWLVKGMGAGSAGFAKAKGKENCTVPCWISLRAKTFTTPLPAANPEMGLACVTKQAKLLVAVAPAGGSNERAVAPFMLVHPAVLFPIGGSRIPGAENHWYVKLAAPLGGVVSVMGAPFKGEHEACSGTVMAPKVITLICRTPAAKLGLGPHDESRGETKQA